MSKMKRNEIAVMGEKIPTVIENVDIFKLRYWVENPRVNSVIKQTYGTNSVTDEQIEKELWEKCESVKDLYHDIEKHGGLIDEVLVKDNTVLEGNSRLCAYRHLYKRAEQQNDEDAMLKWSYIRARIIPNDTPNKFIFSILGTWHIKGKAEWDTFEKAAYLKRMNTDYGYTMEQIADSISETEKFVQDHIDAYDMMVENNIYTLEKFSYFYELTKNKHIKEITQENKEILPKVIEAIKDNRFKRAEEVRDLPKVLKDKKAKKLFIDQKGDFDEALETAINSHPEYDDSLYNNIKKVTKLLEKCSVERIEEIKVDKRNKYLLEKFCKEVIRFCKKIGIKHQQI